MTTSATTEACVAQIQRVMEQAADDLDSVFLGALEGDDLHRAAQAVTLAIISWAIGWQRGRAGAPLNGEALQKLISDITVVDSGTRGQIRNIT